MTTEPTTAGELGRPVLCQDRQDEQCSGTVDFRAPLSGTGAPTIRCVWHWDRRLELQARLRRDYPDSSTPPAWWTALGGPAYAGESWDEPQ